jgi:hypothetical protein
MWNRIFAYFSSQILSQKAIPPVEHISRLVERKETKKERGYILSLSFS